MLHTTLVTLKAAGACSDRLAVLRGGLGPDWPANKPISILDALPIVGLPNVLWGFGAVLPGEEGERDRLSRTLACDYAEHVLPIFERVHPNDKRPRGCIEVARRHLRGEATDKERAAAGDAAWAAARAAAGAAAGAAAWAAAWDAAAWAAAWAAAGAAARAAAWDAELAWQTQRLVAVVTAVEAG